MPRKTKDNALWRRVGRFVRARRTELGLSQGNIIKALGYTSRNSVSNIEVGREGLPAKRVYAWADILEVPRDQFFRFVTGEAVPMGASATEPEAPSHEEELLEVYRRLPASSRRRLLDHAKKLERLAGAALRPIKAR